MRAQVGTALVVLEVAARRGCQAARVIMVVMVIEGMDGVSANHGCELTHTHRTRRLTGHTDGRFLKE